MCPGLIRDLFQQKIEREEILPQVFGGVLFLALVVFGIVYCIKTIKNVHRVAREGK